MSEPRPPVADHPAPATPAEPTDEPGPGAPFGYKRDEKTGEIRARLHPRPASPPPGRRPHRRVNPLPEQPPEARADLVVPELPTGPQPDKDVPPARPAARPEQPGGGSKPAPRMPRAGVITKGVNKLYRRAGKIFRAWDRSIGEAFILCSQNTSEDPAEDDSVGAAWEELCKTNPRVRRVVLAMIAGGTAGALLEAHLPIAMAIFTKDAIARRIPFGRILQSLAEPDEDEEQGNAMPGGMNMDDVMQAAQTFAAQQVKIMQQAEKGAA
jgi:hypothetical protein